MPFEFRVLPERRLSFFQLSGVLTVREGRRRFLDYMASDLFDPRFVLFNDASSVATVEVGFTELFLGVVGMQAALRRFEEPVDSIMLVGNETVFGTARMLQQALALTTRISLLPTLSEAEALAWAGVEVPLAQLRAEAGFAAAVVG
ncbi:MAG: hypothetical protein JNN06_11380 [Gemmobacter sp.]|uniref:hypothetical protein n=1 Tax=Gemmobacter sp. TaxID=1898957 RepID=UPI001A57092D|nr:hypothetical protein [Gemmobacter sp.]MBL8562869.1 hypothetical protein [Gemmobacter sp.]